jgi:thiamine biosynthesis protein ThiS
MRVSVFIQRENKKKTIDVEKGATVQTLLQKLKMNPEVVLVARNKEIILADTKLNDKDVLELLSVISGG